tara:strand:+ start:177 stop:305 length:129 start_codon:yes stop_codon:yes gene_type:complete
MAIGRYKNKKKSPKKAKNGAKKTKTKKVRVGSWGKTGMGVRK